MINRDSVGNNFTRVTKPLQAPHFGRYLFWLRLREALWVSSLVSPNQATQLNIMLLDTQLSRKNCWDGWSLGEHQNIFDLINRSYASGPVPELWCLRPSRKTSESRALTPGAGLLAEAPLGARFTADLFADSVVMAILGDQSLPPSALGFRHQQIDEL